MGLELVGMLVGGREDRVLQPLGGFRKHFLFVVRIGFANLLQWAVIIVLQLY